MTEKYCESHAVSGEKILAIGHSDNPDFSGYDLCQECISYYDSQPPIGAVARTDPRFRELFALYDDLAPREVVR